MASYLIHQVRISGRVQGVGFRSFVSRVAKNWRLGGWVINNFDGTVSVEARGAEEKVRGFLEEVKRGSFFSRVDEMEVLASEKVDEKPDMEFEIRY